MSEKSVVMDNTDDDGLQWKTGGPKKKNGNWLSFGMPTVPRARAGPSSSPSALHTIQGRTIWLLPILDFEEGDAVLYLPSVSHFPTSTVFEPADWI